MNIVAKKKIEQAIQEDLRAHIDVYRNKRSAEYDTLKEKLEEKPSPDVLTILKEGQASYKKLDDLEKKLAVKGYSFASYGSRRFANDDLRLHLKEHPSLQEFSRNTEKRVQSILSLGRGYTLKIYSEKGEIEKVLADFNKDIANLLK